MLWYLNQVKRLTEGFHSFLLEHVPRGKNSHADLLATLAAMSQENLPRIILMEDYALPTYDVLNPIGVNLTRVGPSWMDPLVAFLKNEALPKDKTEVEKVRRKAPRFWLSEDQKLYKRSCSGSTCCAFILREWRYYWKSCMRGFVVVILEVGHLPIEP